VTVVLNSQEQLAEAATRLWEAVMELAVTVFEDHPADTNLVMIDDLMERVSELQGACDAIRRGVDRPDSGRADVLAVVDEAADAAVIAYWRDLRSYRPIFELRRAARMRSPEWRGWATGVEQALEHCAQPIDDMRAAIRAAWQALSLLGTSSRVTEPGGHCD